MVEVEAGVVLDVLNAELNSYGLMVGPDPSSSAVATIGGMAGNNSTGSHSFMYGMIADYITEFEIILADGEKIVINSKPPEEVSRLSGMDTSEGRLYREISRILNTYKTNIENGYPHIWRNVAGYGLNRILDSRNRNEDFNLAPLIVGSEGTLAGISRIKLNVVEKPHKAYLMILHFDDLSTALARVLFLLKHQPSAVELMSFPVLKLAHDHSLFRPVLESFVDGLPGCVLFVEYTGNNESELADQASKLEDALRQDEYHLPINQCVTPEQIAIVWNIRKSVLGLLVSNPKKTKPIWIIDDASVPVEEMVSFTEEVTRYWICALAAKRAVTTVRPGLIWPNSKLSF